MFTNIYKKLLKIISKNLKLIYFILFVLLIILSLFPRSIEVLNRNPIFGFDQGRDYLVAKNIVVGHKLTLIGAEIGSGSANIKGIFQGPFYYYFLSVAFILSKGDPNGAVLLMFLFSIATVAFSFYLGKKLFGTFFGLITALLVAISPNLIAQARFAWAPFPESIFILSSFYFTYLFKQNKKINIFLAAFLAAFIYNFEFAVAIPICLGLLTYSIYYFRKDLKAYLALFFGFIIAFLPMIFFEIRHGFMGFRGLITYLASHKQTTLSFYLSMGSLIKDHLSYFLYNVSNTLPKGGLISPIIIIISLFLLTLYFIKKEKDTNLKKFILFLLFLVPVHFFVFYFLQNTVWDYYLTALNFVYIIIISYLLYSSFKNKSYGIFTVLFVFIAVLTFLGAGSAIRTTTYDYSDYGGAAKLKGKIDAIDYIYKDAGKKKFSLLVFSPPVYTYPYDYLIWWYGERKYHYSPHREKKGTFYLLIEKDPYKPWSYEGWLETVIKTGDVVYTKTLPSRFIIQKRIHYD